MAGGALINGRVERRPGAYGRMDTSALGGSSPSSRGLLAILCELERGGEPGVAQRFSTSGALAAVLGERDASILTRLVFTPSNHPRIPGGANQVTLVRVNPATRASLTVNDADGDAAVNLLAPDWGAFGNQIQVQIEAGGMSGLRLSATVDGETNSADNIGDLDAFTARYTPDGVHVVASMLASVDPTATGAASGFEMAYEFDVTGGAAPFDPSGWMAFDGLIAFAFVAPGAPATITVTGTNKATGETVTDTLSVGAGDTTVTTTVAFSAVTEIDASAMPAAAITITGNAFDLDAATYDTVRKIVDRVQQKSAAGFTATKLAPANLTLANLDEAVTEDVNNVLHTFAADLYDFVTRGAGLGITVQRATGGKLAPIITGLTNLAGGATNTASAADRVAAYEAIEDEDITHVWSDSTDAAEVARASAHVTKMGGVGRNERAAFLGVPAGAGLTTATTGLAARAAAANNRNVSLHCQQTQLFDETGVLATLSPAYTALLAAACDCGVIPGASITRCSVAVEGFLDDPDHPTSPWTVRNNLDDLIRYGYTVLEKVKGVSRWARDVTTHLSDDNPINTSVYANKNANLSIKNARAKMDVLIGLGDVVVSASVARQELLTELERQVTALEIKDFEEASIVVEDLGDTLSCSYNVAPGEARYWIRLNARAVRIPS